MSRPRRLAILATAALAFAACQAPTVPTPAPPTASATPTSASSPAASGQVPTPVPVEASRARVLASADEAFAAGNYQAAADLYQRALNTPPSSADSAALVSAEDGLAGFRSVLADAIRGDEAAARTRLQEMQAKAPASPFARLASQFWDQYGMTADPRAACAQVSAQASQAASELALLRAAGVPVDPATLCTVPR